MERDSYRTGCARGESRSVPNLRAGRESLVGGLDQLAHRARSDPQLCAMSDRKLKGHRVSPARP